MRTKKEDRNICGTCLGCYIPQDAIECETCAALSPEERMVRGPERDLAGVDYFDGSDDYTGRGY